MIPVRAFLRLIATYLRPLRRRVAVLAVGLTVGIGLQLLNPQLIKLFVDGAVAGQGRSQLVPLAVAFIVVAVVQQALAVWATYLAEDIGWLATNRLRGELTAHVVDLDMGWHKDHSSGELIERLDGDVTALSNFFSAMTIKVVGNGVLVLGVLVLLARESWLVGLGVTVLTLGALGLMARLHQVAVGWWQAVRASAAQAHGWVGEQVEGTEDIAANGATAFMEERFATMLRAWLPQQVRGWTGFAMLWSTSILLHGAAMAIVFLVGAHLFGIGSMSIGAVYVVFHYVEMIRHPVEEIRSQLEDLQKAGAAITRIEGLLGTTSRLPASGQQTLPQGPLRVTFDAVTFAYDDENGESADGDATGALPVLHDVSVDIAPGRIVGILGRTGSGKSTIARLVTRLYDPQGGEVRLGGVPAWDVELHDLRARVGMVTQDVQLFHATVRDNLTFFDPDIDDDRLLEVIHRLELDQWLASLPTGLDTVLAPGGSNLSAGQAQLLAFTRIFLADPGVVVLDEASSRLDPATEALIERAVDHLLEGRTGLIIAHRLHTVTRADDILVLRDGRVVEFGPREELANDPTSRFSELLVTGMEEVLT